MTTESELRARLECQEGIDPNSGDPDRDVTELISEAMGKNLQYAISQSTD